MRLGNIIHAAPLRRAGKRAYPLLSMTMRDGLVRPEEKFKKRVASADTSAYKVVKHNQLVVGFPIDEGVLAFQTYYPEAIVSPAYYIWDINPEIKVNIRYFERYLRSAKALAFYRDKLRGTTARRRTLPDDIFLSLDVPLPSFDEQRRIAAILDKADAIRNKRQDALKLANDLVKSQFIEMFGDLSVNNMGWEVKPFPKFAKIDATMTTEYEKYADHPHIGIDSIESGTGALKGYRTVRQDSVKSGKYIFTSDHIIYSKIRPNLNKVALPTFEGLCSADAYPILNNIDNCNKIFLAYVLRSELFLSYILPLSSRTNFPKANREQITGFSMPLPPPSLQNQFAAFVEQADKSKFAMKNQLEEAEVVKNSLMQEYFQ